MLLGLVGPDRPAARGGGRGRRATAARPASAVKMITGDHAATARAIAGSSGSPTTPRVVDRPRTSIGSTTPRCAAWRATTAVFARTSPEHKLRLVEALQAEGAVVAMTGDGVNDAPALKRADVGVAMGRKGTEAAKEAAQMVLADDNFASIVAAVREGRTVYDNLRKVIAWSLPTNGRRGLLHRGRRSCSGSTLPITPVQILWVNMVTAGHARPGARLRAGRARTSCAARRAGRTSRCSRASCSWRVGPGLGPARWPAPSACSAGRRGAASPSRRRARSP